MSTHKLKYEQDLASAPIPKLFKRFAIPCVIGMLSVGVQSVIDGVVVGNFLGKDALSGVGLILPLYSFIAALAIVIGVGSQTLVSIGQGEGDYNKAKDSMTTGIISIIAFCIVAGVVVLVWSSETVAFLGGNAALEGYSIGYIEGLFPFIPIIGCAFYNDYMLRALGHPKASMVLMSLSVVLNITFNILFITVFNLGTFGVGLATGLAFTISILVSIYILQRKGPQIRLFNGRFKVRLLWDMFYNGSSEGVSELASGVTIFLFNLTLMKYLGESGVAAFTMINYIYFVGVITLIGVSDGVIPIISYNFGSKRYDRSRAVFKLAILVNVSIGATLFLVLVLFGPTLIEMFLRGESKDVDVIEIASKGAQIYALAFLVNWFNILTASFFTAIADAKRSVIISALRGIVFMSVAVISLPIIFGIEYVWFSVPIAELLTLFISIAIIWKQFKKWDKTQIS